MINEKQDERLPIIGYATPKPNINTSQMSRELDCLADEYNNMFYGNWNAWYANHYWHNLKAANGRERYYDKFQKLLDYSFELNYRLNVYMKHELFVIVGFNSKNYFFIPCPENYFEIDDIPDYADCTINQLRGKIQTSSSTSLISSDLCDVKPSTIKSNIKDKQSRVDKLKQDIEDVKVCKNAELAALKAEIDAKQAELEKRKADLMSVLESKKAEMMAQMEQLENQLFVLDTEIYGIRCFLGETTNFIHIRKGKSAPIDQPILLFQKMHFLDEDMGKLCSLYDFDFSNIHLFEKFIQCSDEALELFCPSTKCVSLVKISRTSTYFAPSQLAYNILSEYQVYHGDTIGILIRNGDNLYIGWTDDEKVKIGENMFYVPGKVVYNNPADAKHAQSSKYDIASRYFIFSILQGCLEHSKLIQLPEGKYNFTVPSKYIVYAAADNWIRDNKYGSFSDMVDKYHKGISHKEGDMIISTQSLYANGDTHMWGHVKNDRGIGYADRTHDVHYEDNTVYKLNKVVVEQEYDLWYVTEEGHKYRHTYTYYPEHDGDLGSWQQTTIDSWKSRYPDNKFVEFVPDYQYKYYVSLRKNDAWDRYEPYIIPPRANFEVDHDEFINLTFFNSEFVKHVIVNNNLGSYNKNYAYLIKYLNTMLKFLKDREVSELELISKYTDNIPDDWMVKLSDWKLENNVHYFGVRAASKFAKSLTN